VRSQVYGGLDSESFTATAAIDATAGQVLMHNGAVISTPYHSTSGGRTANAIDVWAGRPVPYLVSVPDPYDSISPHHRWGPFAFDGKTVAQKLELPKLPIDLTATRNPSRRISSVIATFGDGTTAIVPGNTVRSALGLRSTWFDLGVLSLAKPTAPVAYGSKATLTVVARGVQEVLLEQKVEGAWKGIGTLKPAPAPFGVVVKPTATADYRLTTGTASTPAMRLPVAPLLRFHPAPTPTGLGGTVKPVLAGVSVAIEREDETGGWIETARALVDANGEFAAAFDLEPGTYRARIAPARGFAAAVSPVLRVVPA
jgi:hypothetical protein